MIKILWGEKNFGNGKCFELLRRKNGQEYDKCERNLCYMKVIVCEREKERELF